MTQATNHFSTSFKEGKIPFTQIPDWLLECGRWPKEVRPTHAQLVVLLNLYKYAWNTGSCHPAYITLAADAGLTKDGAMNAIKQLLRLGLIEKESRRRTGGASDSNSYQLPVMMPSHIAKVVNQSSGEERRAQQGGTVVGMDTEPPLNRVDVEPPPNQAAGMDVEPPLMVNHPRGGWSSSGGVDVEPPEIYTGKNTQGNTPNNNNDATAGDNSRRGRGDDGVDYLSVSNNNDAPAGDSRRRGRRGDGVDYLAVSNNDDTPAGNSRRRDEDAEGLANTLPPPASANPPADEQPPLTAPELARYQLAERRLRAHYAIPPSRSPSPPTVKLLLELARDYDVGEIDHIFDVVDREKDRSAGVPPRQQYLRTTMANVKREREGGEGDERTTQGRPRPHGAAIRGGGGSGAAAAETEPTGLKELREQVRAMRASGGGYPRPARGANW